MDDLKISLTEEQWAMVRQTLGPSSMSEYDWLLRDLASALGLSDVPRPDPDAYDVLNEGAILP